MSALDQRPAFFTPDWQYGPLPANPEIDNSVNTNQVTSDNPLYSTLEPDGGNISETVIQSREVGHAALPAVNYSYAAGGLFGFPTIGDFLLGFTDPESTNPPHITTFATQPTGELQGWATQQSPVLAAWDSSAGPCFLPTLDLDSTRWSFDSLPQNHIDALFREPPHESFCTQHAKSQKADISTAIHGMHQIGHVICCQQCNVQFSTRTLLENHAKKTQHAPYLCRCGTSFSRLDVLRRHIRTFQPEISYPCPHCKKHRGSRAFARLDHLTQHLRGYHNMESGDDSDDTFPQKPLQQRKTTFKCMHETCSFSERIFEMSPPPDQQLPRTMSRTFQTQGELTKHLREVHDESPFPCEEIGCSRVGGRGFFRRKDLAKHVNDHHSTVDFEPSVD